VAKLQQGRFALAAGTASLHLFGSLALTLLGLETVGLLWAR
jgi:CrcB protein